MVRASAPINLNLFGDGVSKTFVSDITKAPISYNVNGNNPVDVVLFTGPAGASVSLSGTRISVTVANASDISSSGTLFQIFLLFNGA